jgi:hypothetical protein
MSLSPHHQLDCAGAVSSDRENRPLLVVRRAVLLGLIFMLPCRVGLAPSRILEPDLWWHLRTGDWILQHRSVPRVDQFSTMTGHPWIAYSWSLEALMSLIYRRVGLAGILSLQLIVSTLVIGVLYLLLCRVQNSFLRAAALTALGGAALGPSFAVRPWLMTILFFLVELLILYHAQRSAKRLWLAMLPPLFALWANVHIQFVYGLAFLLLAAADRPLTALARRAGFPRTETFGQIHRASLWACFGASVLATLVNPYGVRLYGVVFEYARHSADVLNYVEELHAMDFRRPVHFLVLALLMAAVATIARRRQPRTFEVVAIIFAAFLAFRMVRDGWILIVVSILALGTPEDRLVGRRQGLPPAYRLLVAVTLLLGVAITLRARDVRNEKLKELVAGTFPEAAAAYIERHALQGPLYNDFNWGGYWIWRLPGMKVNIDGRTNLYGDRRISRNSATWAGLKGWDTDPELARANLVVGSIHYPLVTLLRSDARFRVAYEDGLAVVFVSTSSSGEATATGR